MTSRDGPWWNPTYEVLNWSGQLPRVIRLCPEYGADLPLWDTETGIVPWQATKFSPPLLDRLAAWQGELQLGDGLDVIECKS
jgi:hypothetical protein